jgi:Nucleotidyl transferase AbiEii toxin, Type IV TA system
MTFIPNLTILPRSQRLLWDELGSTPLDFTLYGGTAIALRLGHRVSIDFDFFSTQPFIPQELMATIPYLQNGILRQSAANTLTVNVERGEPVQLSYFGKLQIGQIVPHEIAKDNNIAIASLLDLAGMKVSVVTQRAEIKDYLDIHALITQAKIPLSLMLSAAKIIYGDEFNALIALKAISYHDDESLTDLAQSIRRDLINAVRQVDVNKLPSINAIRAKP